VLLVALIATVIRSVSPGHEEPVERKCFLE
jgi:hypothetical protein